MYVLLTEFNMAPYYDNPDFAEHHQNIRNQENEKTDIFKDNNKLSDAYEDENEDNEKSQLLDKDYSFNEDNDEEDAETAKRLQTFMENVTSKILERTHQNSGSTNANVIRSSCNDSRANSISLFDTEDPYHKTSAVEKDSPISSSLAKESTLSNAAVGVGHNKSSSSSACLLGSPSKQPLLQEMSEPSQEDSGDKSVQC